MPTRDLPGIRKAVAAGKRVRVVLAQQPSAVLDDGFELAYRTQHVTCLAVRVRQHVAACESRRIARATDLHAVQYDICGQPHGLGRVACLAVQFGQPVAGVQGIGVIDTEEPGPAVGNGLHQGDGEDPLVAGDKFVGPPPIHFHRIGVWICRGPCGRQSLDMR